MRGRALSRRTFLRRGGSAVLGATTLGAGSYAYAHDVEPHWIDIARVSLPLPRLAAAFHGYRLVQMSDIHMDDTMTPARLAAIVALVNAQQPDLVAITGDFVTADAASDPVALAAVLRELRPRDATAAVMGNHDHWWDPVAIRGVMRDGGIIDVDNAVHTLRRGAARLHIAGVDDYMERQDRLDRVLAALPSEGAAILLAHEPDYADISSASGRFDLQISGHSHGGQLRLPLWGPLILPRYGTKYPDGRYLVGAMAQYTNRGLGMLRPHVRFNCRPEITVFTLQASHPRRDA